MGRIKKFRSIAFAFVFIFFVSCGGGGSSSDSGLEGSFSIPEGAVSVTLFADAGIGIGDLDLYTMTGPDGSEYVDNTYQRLIMPTFTGPTIARTIPDGDYTPELAGTWNYRFTCGSCDLLTK